MTTLTPEDRARLRDLAAKATPGPWRADWIEADSWWSITGAPYEEYVCPEVATVEGGGGDEARFIAAANPATVTALLDALDAAEEEISALRAEVRTEHRSACAAREALDKAEAAVERVRVQVAEWDHLAVEHRHHTLHPWTAADRLRGALGTASPYTCSMCGEPITGLHIVDGCTAARTLDGDT